VPARIEKICWDCGGVSSLSFLLSIGYPKVRPAPKKKLGIESIVHSESYHDLSDDDLRAAYNAKYPDWKKESPTSD